MFRSVHKGSEFRIIPNGKLRVLRPVSLEHEQTKLLFDSEAVFFLSIPNTVGDWSGSHIRFPLERKRKNTRVKCEASHQTLLPSFFSHPEILQNPH